MASVYNTSDFKTVASALSSDAQDSHYMHPATFEWMVNDLARYLDKKKC